MEMSCDEAVLQRLGDGVRADYSACLLRMASGRGLSPAFAGGDTKGRIKNLGRWKKPRLWAVIAAAAACSQTRGRRIKRLKRTLRSTRP